LLTKLEHYDIRGNALKLIVVSFRQKTVRSGGKHLIIYNVNYCWGPTELDFRPFVLFIIHKWSTQFKSYENYSFCWWYSFSS